MTEGPITPGSWPAPEHQSPPLETTAVVVPAAPSARRPRRRGRRSLLAAIVVVVVGAVAAAVVVVQRDPRTAGEALAGAQRFVGEATSFRFTYAAEDVTSFGDPDGSGGVTTTRSTGSGEWSEGRWRSVTDTGFDMVDESILAGGTVYNRFAEDAAALEGEQWDSYPAPPLSREDMLAAVEEMAGFADEVTIAGAPGVTPDELEIEIPEGLDESLAVMTAVMIYLGGSGGPTPLESGLGGDPSGFLDAIKQMAGPERVSDDGARSPSRPRCRPQTSSPTRSDSRSRTARSSSTSTPTTTTRSATGAGWPATGRMTPSSSWSGHLDCTSSHDSAWEPKG
ncbi:MAG TPA: hypothetical protein VFH23_04165 [Jiangellaceae bacterium]|nr:hypothetical protein [Jiangellaceae bacterium]